MLKREVILAGKTYKIQYGKDAKVYITINGFADDPTRPFEIFLNSHDGRDDILKTLGVALSALCRTTPDIEFLVDNFERIVSDQGFWWKGTHVRSLAHAIAIAVRDFRGQTSITSCDGKQIEIETIRSDELYRIKDEDTPSKIEVPLEESGDLCPSCKKMTIKKMAGCRACTNPNCSYVGDCG